MDYISKKSLGKKLELYLSEVTIQQVSLDQGITLRGSGVIKQNHRGDIEFTFVCTDWRNIELTPGQRLPSSTIRPEEQLTLTGSVPDIGNVSATDFAVVLPDNIDLGKNDKPFIIKTYLSSVTVEQSTLFENKGIGYSAYINQNLAVPYNTSYEFQDSEGNWSSSDTIAKFSVQYFNVEIHKHDGWSKIAVFSEETLNPGEVDDFFESLMIGLSIMSGKRLQPVCIEKYEHLSQSIIVNATDEDLLELGLWSTIPKSYIDPTNPGTVEVNQQYDFINSLWLKRRESEECFQSIRHHWLRAWHASTTDNNDLLRLCLTVAIEGLIKDSIEPLYKKHNPPEAKFEQQKSDLADKVMNLEECNHEHLQTITKFINGWGAAKPGVIMNWLTKGGAEGIDKRIWNEARNRSAHPTLKSMEDNAKINKHVVACFDMFIELLFLVVRYQGPMMRQMKYEIVKVNFEKFL